MPHHGTLDTPKPSSKKGCIIALIITGVIFLVGAGVFGWQVWLVGSQASEIAEKFQRTFNVMPEIKINSRVVVHATTPVLELVTVKKEAVVQHQWTHTWLHSTKTIEVEATFTARAGYDLQKPFSVLINTRDRTYNAILPPVKILSIGMSDVRIRKDEDGLWNKLSAEDRQEAIQALEGAARVEFHNTDILREARAEGEKRVNELLESIATPQNFRLTETPPAH